MLAPGTAREELQSAKDYLCLTTKVPVRSEATEPFIQQLGSGKRGIGSAARDLKWRTILLLLAVSVHHFMQRSCTFRLPVFQFL